MELERQILQGIEREAEARKEGEEMIARARREIQLAKDTAVKELYDRTAETGEGRAKQVEKSLVHNGFVAKQIREATL